MFSLVCPFIIIIMFVSIVPSLTPSSVTAQAINSSSVLVSWGPVPGEGRNGLIIGYSVFVTRQDASRPDWKEQTCNNMSWCEITDLDMYTRYYINVTGMTVKGIGPPAVVEALTQKGGKVLLLITLPIHCQLRR